MLQEIRAHALPIGPWGLLLPTYKLQAIDKRLDWPGSGTWAWNLGLLRGGAMKLGQGRAPGGKVAASLVRAGSFLPSGKNTLVLSTSWALPSGLQFTSRMAPQPLGPQTQFFCKDDRNVGSGRCQVNPLLPRCLPPPPSSGGRAKFFFRVMGTSRSESASSSVLQPEVRGPRAREHCPGMGHQLSAWGQGKWGLRTRGGDASHLTGTANPLLLLATPPGVDVNPVLPGVLVL